jgi:hypothetical protein
MAVCLSASEVKNIQRPAVSQKMPSIPTEKRIGVEATDVFNDIA